MSGINPTIENHVDPWDKKEKYEKDKNNIQGLKWNMGKELKNLKDETLKASIKKDLDELQAALTKKDKEDIRKERNELSVRTTKGATDFLTAIKNEQNPRIKYNILVSASVQTLLHQHEFLEETGEQGKKRIDGIWGKKSIAAMKKFQEEWNKLHPQDTLKVTGFPNSKTIQKLLEWNTNHTVVNTEGESEAISEEESTEIIEAKTVLGTLSKVEISKYSDDTIVSLNDIKVKFKGHIDNESQKKINKIQEKYSIYQKISGLQAYNTADIPQDLHTATPEEMLKISNIVTALEDFTINATNADLSPENGYSDAETAFIQKAEDELKEKKKAFMSAKNEYEGYWEAIVFDQDGNILPEIGNFQKDIANIKNALGKSKKDAKEDEYYFNDETIKNLSLDDILKKNPLPVIKQKNKGIAKDTVIPSKTDLNNEVIKNIINGTAPQYQTILGMIKEDQTIDLQKVYYTTPTS